MAIRTLTSIVKKSARTIARQRDEKGVCKVLSARFRAAEIPLYARKVLRSPGLPSPEVDLISPELNLAIEVKVNPRFYEGIGQATAARRLYGYEAVLLHVVDKVDPALVDVMRRLKRGTGIKVILVGRRPVRVHVVT